MINDAAQPIYSYPDQLILRIWPEWVETIFAEQPSNEHRNPRGFQQLAGKLAGKLAGEENADPRSRATEAYRMGLLLHRVVSEKTGASGVMPKGWEYVCQDKTTLSKLGYIAYAIGKALANEPKNAEFKTTLNFLHLVFALSLGTENSGKTVSTLLVYCRVIECFRKEIGEAEFDAHYDEYSRVLAGAVFNTLDNIAKRSNLIDEYINSDVITSLILENRSDKVTSSVTAAILKAKVNGITSSLPAPDQITRQKAPLFWAAPRGIFTNAILAGSDLVAALIPLDRACMKQNSISILNSVLVVDGNSEHHLLEQLNDLLLSKSETNYIWRNIMEQVSKGVYSALTYLENAGTGWVKPATFHLHGASEVPIGTQELEVDILKQAIPIQPDIGTIVLVQELKFKITAIEDLETKYSFKLEAIPNPI